jgi:NTE family protein
MRFCLVLVLFFFHIICSGQKVGVVLSGGGARGLTHIGVLKALEENDIPIDYITGTSIGAIVGSLYSMGLSPDEIIEVFKDPSFDDWVNGRINEKYHYLYKDNFENPALLKLKVDFRDSIQQITFRTHLIPSSPMDFAFMKLYSGVEDIARDSFDELFVPFRCVAADIHNKRSVIFRKGNLGMSVRASMTFPFYFRPITVDSLLLYDGGIYNNFPYDIMVNDFDPGYVIGSQVARNSSPPVTSDLILQLENMVAHYTNYEVDTTKGIMIRNFYSDIELLEFDRVDELVNRGYESTLKIIDSIKQRVTARISKDELNLKRRFFRERVRDLNFDKINISGIKDKEKGYIIKSLRRDYRLFNIGHLENEYNKLLFDENIVSLYPTAKFNENTGFYELNLRVERNKPLTLYIGGNLSSGSINQGYFGLQYNYFRNNSISLLGDIQYGKIYSAGALKLRAYFAGAIPFRINSMLSYNKYDYYKLDRDLFFKDSKPMYVEFSEANFMFDLGFSTGNNSLIEFGLSGGYLTSRYYSTYNFVTNDTKDLSELYNLGLYSVFSFDNHNYKLFPTEGRRMRFKFGYFYNHERYIAGSTSIMSSRLGQKKFYPRGSADISTYFKLNRYFVIGADFSGYYSGSGLFSNYISSAAFNPAYEPVPISKVLFLPHYRADSYLAVGAKVIYNLTNRIHFRAEGYCFAPARGFEELNYNHIKYNSKYFSRQMYIGNATVVYQTILGPISFSANYFDRAQENWFFQLNFGYLLFNSSVLK